MASIRTDLIVIKQYYSNSVNKSDLKENPEEYLSY